MRLGRILPIAVGAAVVLAVGGYVYYGQQQTEQKQKRARAFQDQPAPVLVSAAKNVDVPIYLDAVGNVKALNTVTVRPQVGGQLHLTVGQGSEVVVDMVDQAIAELAAGCRVEVEAHGDWIPVSREGRDLSIQKL